MGLFYLYAWKKRDSFGVSDVFGGMALKFFTDEQAVMVKTTFCLAAQRLVLWRNYCVYLWKTYLCIPIYINSMQLYTVCLYLETAQHVSGGTSTHHQEHIQLYVQHLVFVTPLMLEGVWNVMVHGDAREENWWGNWRMGCVATKRHMTAEHRLAHEQYNPCRLMCTARLPVVDWTDPPADLNGLVLFA